MKKSLSMKVKGLSIVIVVSLKRLQQNDKLNLNYKKENKAKGYVQYGWKEELSMLVYNPWRILHLKMLHLSLVVASSLNRLYWTMRILLQLLQLISLQKNENEKKTEDYDQYGSKKLLMLVFNPCIMVSLPLFGIIMLRLKSMNRRPWSSVFWKIANWSKHNEMFLFMLRLLLGGIRVQRLILLYCHLWCLRTMWEKMDSLLIHHTLLIW